jgi:hypothetical protein
MIATTFESGMREIIRRMGSDMALEAPSGATRPIRAVITSIGRDDGDLINAVGVEARVMYLLSIDPPPEKFDRVILPNTRSYVLQDVLEIMVDNQVIGHKCPLRS